MLLAALGDFPRDNTTVEQRPLLGDGELPFPLSTQQVEAQALANGAEWLGLSTRGPAPLPLLLLPSNVDCVVAPAATARVFPGTSGGEALATSRDGRWALAVGTRDGDGADGLLVDLGAGSATRLTALRAGTATLAQRRADASLTAVDGAFLIAGGVDPVEGVTHSTAELFRPEGPDARTLVELGERRSAHGAVRLPNGEVLLVGGVDGEGRLLRGLVAVDPTSGRTRRAGLATLQEPRRAPFVATLDDGRVVVAGGVDAQGSPASTVEWLSADGAETLASSALAPRFERAFSVLAGSSLLAVGGCQERAPAAGEDCSVCARGCPPSTGWDGWWLAANGVVHRIEALEAPAPRLVAADAGAPWLFTGNRWLRFDPWRARFVELAQATSWPAPDGGPLVAVDPGAFLWLARADGGAHLTRHSTANALATPVGPLLLTLPADDRFPPSRAAGLVPSRPLDGSTLSLDAELTLRGADAAVALADLELADFTLELTTGGGATPLVQLRGVDDFALTTVGDARCPWPVTNDVGLRLERRGSTLTANRTVLPCTAPGGRVRIVVAATEASTVTLRSLRVERR